MAKRKIAVAPDQSAESTGPQSLELSQAEIDAILAARQKVGESKVGVSELANALITAIEATRPPQKKNPFNRKPGDPWQPTDGSKKPKLRRVMYQHGVELNPKQLYPEEIELLNQIKPGTYCAGVVRVTRRRDRSVDVSYPVRTAAQRLRLVNQFGITSLAALCQRILAEASDPKRFKGPDEQDED